MSLAFDATYYLQTRPDVLDAFNALGGGTGLPTPAQFAEAHYNTFGRNEGSNPNATFNTAEYLAANPDVEAAGVNPFEHYLQFGVSEGRAPSDSFIKLADFDVAAYLAANPDLIDAGITTPEAAYRHLVIHGQFEVRTGVVTTDGVPIVNGVPDTAANTGYAAAKAAYDAAVTAAATSSAAATAAQTAADTAEAAVTDLATANAYSTAAQAAQTAAALAQTDAAAVVTAAAAVVAIAAATSSTADDAEVAGANAAATTAKTAADAAKATADAKVAAAAAQIVAYTPQTFALTTSVDKIVGTLGNDTIAAGAATFTVNDQIDGGAGTDTMNWSEPLENISGVPTGAVVKNVEILNVTLGGDLTLDTTGNFAGLTTLNTNTNGARQTITAAATTNVTATVASQTGTDISFNGGKDVTVNATGVTTGKTTIGDTSAAAGAVTVVSTATVENGFQGAIAVKGGTSVNVTTATSNSVNTTTTQAKVTVTGNAATTSVTVSQDKAVTAAETVAGKINGAVTIADVNAASATAAGTIATVTLNNYGNSTINSGALTTVNLSGTAGTLGLTLGALTTAVVDTLALNVDELSSTNNITLDAKYKILNLGSTGKASTIAVLDGAGVATLNISGSADLTITGSLREATKTIDASTATGNVTITHTNSAVLDIKGGAGDDKFILGATYAGGTTEAWRDIIDGGAGRDTLSIQSAEANVTENQANVTNIEIIEISNAVANSINLTHFASADTLKLTAAGVSASTFTFKSGSTMEFVTGGAGDHARTFDIAGIGTSDSLTLKGVAGTNLGSTVQTFTGIEVLNVQTGAAGTGDFTFGGALTMDASDGGVTKIVVSGGNSLILVGTVTANEIDASGLTGDALLNMDGGGLAGAGKITGTAKNDIIIGSDGNDVIIAGAGDDKITGGKGNDEIDISGGGSNRIVFANIAANNGTDTITGFNGGPIDSGGDVLDFSAIFGVGIFDGRIFDSNPLEETRVLANGESSAVIRLVDIVGGDDIMTAAGLLNALNGGEFKNIVPFVVGGTVIFLAATSLQSTTFNIYYALVDESSFFATVGLVGVVSGSDLQSLTADNFDLT